jgi:lipopolysaccharide export system permease protein
MRTLDRYIGRTFLTACLLILAVLAVLLSLFELIAQLEDVGRGGYGLGSALVYVLCTLPGRLLDLLPVATLLGGIVALGLLNDRGEIVAMEAAGVSRARTGAAVLGASLLLMAVAALLAELVVPGLEARARRMQTLTGEGFWVRRGRTYIHAGRMLGTGVAADLDLFTFDGEGRLQTAIQARRAVLEADGRWLLREVEERRVADGAITVHRAASRPMGEFLRVDQVGLLGLPPASLSTPDLLRSIEALEQSGQNADRYAIALWRKLGMPLGTGAMALLALSFVFGPTRGVGAGSRVALGTFVGIVLYFFDQMSIQWGLLLNLSPVLTALAPFVLIGAVAGLRLRRIG